MVSGWCCRKHSKRFSVPVFQDRFRSFLKRIGAPVDAVDVTRAVLRGFRCNGRCARIMIVASTYPAMAVREFPAMSAPRRRPVWAWPPA